MMAFISPDQLADLGFVARPESWVAMKKDLFFKMPRSCDDINHDFTDAGCITAARTEYDNMRQLAALDPLVLRPLALESACLVYPRLAGPDMYELLRHTTSKGEIESCIAETMGLLAHIHSKGARDYPLAMKDYGDGKHIAAAAQEAGRLATIDGRSIVMNGFEVRNFRYDKRNKAWRFFDPHSVTLGHVEEDVARFVVSLLMIN